MFDDMEINPLHIGVGLLGGILAIIVMSQVEVNLIYKVGSFIATSILCYFMAGRILGE